MKLRVLALVSGIVVTTSAGCGDIAEPTGQPAAPTPKVCGDAILGDGELCDDGNLSSGDGCSSQCTPEAGWHCVGQPSLCQPICGDGLIVALEECDDANQEIDDGCDLTCLVEFRYICEREPSECAPYCGDGFIVGDEVCDAGLDNSDDWSAQAQCRSDCTGLAPHCGDGTVQSEFETCDEGEANDDGWHAEPGGCLTDCSGPSPHCGDGLVTHEEACDDGESNAATWALEPHCNVSCSGLAAHCGDGVLDDAEQCDDGDRTDGDGCSSACQIEVNATCAGEPSVCIVTLFVARNAAELGNGTSWSDAFTHLNDALDRARHNASEQRATEIWIATGTYRPDEGEGRTSGDPMAYFDIPGYTTIYGGFAGTEQELQQRDPSANPVLLTGDLQGDDSADTTSRDDNSCKIARVQTHGAPVILDGIRFQGGAASYGDARGCNVWIGGALYIHGSPVELRHCEFSNNEAGEGGAI